MDDVRVPVPAGSIRFMDLLRTDMRARGYAFPTERTYLHWIRRFIHFNGRRHPKYLGKPEIERFLDYLAVHATVAPSTQRTALNALMYLYKNTSGVTRKRSISATPKPRAGCPRYSRTRRLNVLSTT